MKTDIATESRQDFYRTSQVPGFPKIKYQRSVDYRDISPSIEDLASRGFSFASPPDINLADYWDYVEAMGFEAFLAEREKAVPPLRRLSVFITDLCNLSCDYCYLRSATQKSIDLGWLTERLPEARKLGVAFLDLMGLGEPTLLKDLPDVVAEATSLGMVATVGTHGATPNLQRAEFRERLFAAGPIKFRVSLDSSEPAHHNLIRIGNPTWDKALAFIRSAVEAREKGARLAIFINRVVSKDNIETLLADLKFYAQLGVDDVHLIPVRFHAEKFLSVGRIHQFNEEVSPAIEELGAYYRLPWLRQAAKPFGEDEAEISLAATEGRYYLPTKARDCHIQKSQMLVDARRLPFTCLWSRRNGGGPMDLWTTPPDSLTEMRRQMLAVNYLKCNPQICEEQCTRRLIHANDAAEDHIVRFEDKPA